MTVDDLFDALSDCVEAREELRQRRAEYTGYSPSWALASWIEAEEHAKQRLKQALDAYIDEKMA